MMKLVFGAAGHIGRSVARVVAAADPMQLRAASSRPEGVEALRIAFPRSEVMHADMLSVESMTRVLKDVDAAFIVTPDFFDDRAGAEVLLTAIEGLETRPHIVRIQAELPGMTVERLPPALSGAIGRRGHLEARAMIEASGLPATFLNVLGYYMDDLLIHFGPMLKAKRTLMVPFERAMCWIDPRELGEAAGRAMTGPPPQGPRLFHLNNGEPGRHFAEVAAMISSATGVAIGHDDDPDNFRREIGPMLAAMTGSDAACEYLLADWQMERAHPEHYHGGSILGRLLGRPPLSLSDWLAEHAAALV